ncbi:unnamed protein product [Moneuplotes crassus]|uniref:Uncharacterized protein n=1 Tax=Euplotes crassus TaxID=5936 RepID=A0AAD1XPK9_EUPCR|nr:unnamed protein product [Moneuplotes crassus]
MIKLPLLVPEPDEDLARENLDNLMNGMELEVGILNIIDEEEGKDDDIQSNMKMAYKMNSYLKNIAKIPLYSENSIPYAETEDDLASKSVPDENPLGIGKVQKGIIPSATCKRKDSIEEEFDIISDNEIEEMKEEFDRRSSHAAPAEIYYSNSYPGAEEADYNRYSDQQPQYLLNNGYPAGVYHPPQPIPAYPHQTQPSTANWAFGQPVIKRVMRQFSQ